jgi:hypothetical protein
MSRIVKSSPRPTMEGDHEYPQTFDVIQDFTVLNTARGFDV